MNMLGIFIAGSTSDPAFRGWFAGQENHPEKIATIQVGPESDAVRFPEEDNRRAGAMDRTVEDIAVYLKDQGFDAEVVRVSDPHSL